MALLKLACLLRKGLFCCPGHALCPFRHGLPASTGVRVVALHHVVLRFYCPEDLSLRRFHVIPTQDELVQEVARTVKIEDDVELAHIAEIPVQCFDEEVDELERGQLVFVGRDSAHKKERRVPLEDLAIRGT